MKKNRERRRRNSGEGAALFWKGNSSHPWPIKDPTVHLAESPGLLKQDQSFLALPAPTPAWESGPASEKKIFTQKNCTKAIPASQNQVQS